MAVGRHRQSFLKILFIEYLQHIYFAANCKYFLFQLFSLLSRSKSFATLSITSLTAQLGRCPTFLAIVINPLTDKVAHCIRVRNLIESLSDCRKVIFNRLFIFKEWDKHAELRTFRVCMNSQNDLAILVNLLELREQVIRESLEIQGKLLGCVLCLLTLFVNF
mgnify:CR=1 FL=1